MHVLPGNQPVQKPGNPAGGGALADADQDAADGVQGHQVHDGTAVPAEDAGEQNHKAENTAQIRARSRAVQCRTDDDGGQGQRDGEGAEADKGAKNGEYHDHRGEDGQAGHSLQLVMGMGICVFHIQLPPAVAPVRPDAAQRHHITLIFICQ